MLKIYGQDFCSSQMQVIHAAQNWVLGALLSFQYGVLPLIN